MRAHTHISLAVTSVAAAVLVACGGSDSGGTGTIRFSMTDAPACGFDAVNVTVSKVRVHESDSAGDNDSGWSEIKLEPAKLINLLSLTHGVLEELGQTQLPAGKYTNCGWCSRTTTTAGSSRTPLYPRAAKRRAAHAKRTAVRLEAECSSDGRSGQGCGLRARLRYLRVHRQCRQFGQLQLEASDCGRSAAVERQSTRRRLRRLRHCGEHKNQPATERRRDQVDAADDQQRAGQVCAVPGPRRHLRPGSQCRRAHHRCSDRSVGDDNGSDGCESGECATQPAGIDHAHGIG